MADEAKPIDWKTEGIALLRALLITAAVFLAARFGVKLQVFVVQNGQPVCATPATDCGCDKCPVPPTTKK